MERGHHHKTGCCMPYSPISNKFQIAPVPRTHPFFPYLANSYWVVKQRVVVVALCYAYTRLLSFQRVLFSGKATINRQKIPLLYTHFILKQFRVTSDLFNLFLQYCYVRLLSRRKKEHLNLKHDLLSHSKLFKRKFHTQIPHT